MRAIWLENQTLSVRDDLPIPQCKDGEALVRVRLAGICNTDLEMVRGYYPFTGILGHEFVGEVVENAGFAQSDRVRQVLEAHRVQAPVLNHLFGCV